MAQQASCVDFKNGHPSCAASASADHVLPPQIATYKAQLNDLGDFNAHDVRHAFWTFGVS